MTVKLDVIPDAVTPVTFLKDPGMRPFLSLLLVDEALEPKTSGKLSESKTQLFHLFSCD